MRGWALKTFHACVLSIVVRCSGIDYRSNLTADEVLQLLEQESTDKDWQDSDKRAAMVQTWRQGFVDLDGPYIEPVQYECVECDVDLHSECFQSYHKNNVHGFEWFLLCTQSQYSLHMNLQP